MCRLNMDCKERRYNDNKRVGDKGYWRIFRMHWTTAYLANESIPEKLNIKKDAALAYSNIYYGIWNMQRMRNRENIYYRPLVDGCLK